MKLKLQKIGQWFFGICGRKNAGFTLIELVVVLAVMGILAGAVIVGIANQRVNRNLNIAANELITNLRKLQTYTLTAKGISPTQPVQYYLIKIDAAKPDEYVLQAMYNVTTSPQLANLETVKLPQGIRFAAASPLYIDRPLGFIDQQPSCALVVFKTPFAKVLLSNGCSVSSAPPWDPNTDDYQKILNFIVNTALGTVSSDSSINIKLSDQSGTAARTITVKGISGLIFSQ